MTVDRDFVPTRALDAATAEQLFERILSRLPNGIIVVDPELHVLYANTAAGKLVDADLRRGAPLPDPWPEFSLRSFGEALFSAEPPTGTHLVDSGTHIVCVEGVTPGRAPNAIFVLEDVTERERVRRAERQFVENAAHELRTPLAAIVSVIEVLESGAMEDAAARSRFLAHLRVHSDRLVRLATSLLELERIQARREEPRLDLVRLKPLLVSIAGAIPSITNVAVDVVAPEDAVALANADLLHQAVENIASNAVKHTREGKIVFEARNRGHMAEIEIRDTGSGMDRVELEHAFDRFYRSSARGHVGFGLGLAIADEAIRALDGTITLESVPDRGTTVRIRLPSAKIHSR